MSLFAKKEGLKSLLQIIIQYPGVQAKQLSAELENRSLKTIERQIKEFKYRNE